MEAQTEADRFVLEQVTPLLRPQETVFSAGYFQQAVNGGGLSAFVSAATAKAAHMVLTNQRLILIEARLGALKPLLENRGVVAFERADIKGVHTSGLLLIELANGQMIKFPIVRYKHLSTQSGFLTQLQSSFPRSEAAEKVYASQRRRTIISAVLGLVLGGAYLVYKLVQ